MKVKNEERIARIEAICEKSETLKLTYRNLYFVTPLPPKTKNLLRRLRARSETSCLNEATVCLLSTAAGLSFPTRLQRRRCFKLSKR